MTGLDKAAAFRRAADFMTAVEERSYTRKEDWSLGTAFFHDDFPVKWVFNFMRIEKDDPTKTADQIADEADEVMGRAGLTHRMLHTDDADIAARLRPGLEDRGWRSGPLMIMALETVPPVFHAPGVEVKEISQSDMYAVAKLAAEEHYPEEAEHADELARSREVTVKAANAISLGGCIDGKIAGYCDFYDGGDIGQIEEVNTSDAYRKRGVAKAIVTAGIELSKMRGHDLTFLVADDNDWPKDFYGRLGFVPVGHLYEFRWTEKGY